LRILITSPTYPPFNSGLGNAAAQQAICLVRAGHHVVVATGGNKRLTFENEGIRVETFVLTGAESWLHPIRGDINSYEDFLIKNNWDVVLLNAWQNWATDLALRNLSFISGRIYVYSHCISTNVFFPNQPLRSLLRYLAWRPYWWKLPSIMRRLDGVIFLAERGTDSRFDDLRLARQHLVQLRIIPNSLSPAGAALLCKPAKPVESRKYLMAVGSYQWQKGFDFVIRAFASSRARHHFALHLYGQANSSYNTNLHNLVSRLGLSKESVVFHEGVSGEKLLDAYSQARLVLSGSHTECQPLALLDANATGTPFVARGTGCIAEMPGGLTVRTWSEMSCQLDSIIEDEILWGTLSASGRHSAANIHHPDRIGQQLIDALTTVKPCVEKR
jgi:glycosyltransferase involved in cell wall biosynthesis